MVKYDDKTARGWPLPHRENRLYDDVERLREALNLADEALTAIETHEGVIEGRQDSIDTRLDTILEGATEDSEILDARVDAQDTVHPNLGHNIRNLHRLILWLEELFDYEDSEFRGLAAQFDLVAQAQIQNEINSQNADERRKREIQREASNRIEQDDSLQRQINAVSDGIMRLMLTVQDLAKKRREDSSYEEAERISADNLLQSEINELVESCRQLYEAISTEKSERLAGDSALTRQTDANAEANIRNALSIQKLNERRKADLNREEQSRIEHDGELHREINQASQAGIINALNLADETAKRRKLREVLDAEISERTGHDAQIDSAVLAILQNILTLSELISENDSGLQSQANTNSEAVMQNALNIQEEAEKRRKLLARLIEEKQDREHAIQELRAEIGTLYEISLPGIYESISALQGQSDTNAGAEITNALNLRNEAEKRSRFDSYLQLQIDEAVQKIIENAMLLQNEDAGLQAQINSAARGILENTLTLSEALSRQREAMKLEAVSRIQQDDGLQEQINQLAIANMWLNVREHETRQKVKEIQTEAYTIPGRAATDEEFDEMLDELYSNT